MCSGFTVVPGSLFLLLALVTSQVARAMLGSRIQKQDSESKSLSDFPLLLFLRPQILKIYHKLSCLGASVHKEIKFSGSLKQKK
jgi:hypothetical protein